MTEQLLGKPVAEGIRSAASATLEEGRARGWPAPLLVSAHLGADTPFRFYFRQQARAAEALGIGFRSEVFAPEAGPAALIERVRGLNADAAVHGVLVEHPLPSPLDFSSAVAVLAPEKDADGVGWLSLGRLVAGHPIHAPAVARAAIAVLSSRAIRIHGRRVAVVGRSATVGMPLALLLLARGEGADATVTVAHSRTADLAAALSEAEIIFSCVGRPKLLTRQNVPRGAIIVDVGLSAVPDPDEPGRLRAVGDADAGDLDGWAQALAPVPGGVGPVTVAALMANVVDGWRRQMLAGAAR